MRESKIAAVLDNDSGASRHIGPDTEIIDLGGQFVMPVFIEKELFSVYGD